MFDLDALRAAAAAHGSIARVVIAAHDGSSPREVGAAMLVWQTGQSGTIGGGALEHAAISRARDMLAGPIRQSLTHAALGPALGQCCGGAVTLFTEVYTSPAIAGLTGPVIARSVNGTDMPLAVRRLLARQRDQGVIPVAGLHQGWMIEPVQQARRIVWVWGAGHVGRAVVNVLAGLPDLAITWVDIAPDRFPDTPPAGVTLLPAAEPARLVPFAPPQAEHIVLTYSHALDLDLCHRLLQHQFRDLGLIGSHSKWARFRGRLAALGHGPAAIARITCPIGDPALGKHPQAIAIGVAAAFLRQPLRTEQEMAR